MYLPIRIDYMQAIKVLVKAKSLYYLNILVKLLKEGYKPFNRGNPLRLHSESFKSRLRNDFSSPFR